VDGAYPVRLEVDYPERPLARLSTFFRIFAAIPIIIVLSALGGVVGGTEGGRLGGESAIAGGGIVFLPTLLLIVFRRKYPRWWFDWNRELLRFANRVAVYLALLDDRYPSTDEEQSVHLELEYPDVPTELNRWLPLVKWLLAIPHYIVLFFVDLAALVCVIIAWFAILFTGRYPRGLFDFVVGSLRWNNRVAAYAFVLTTDRYPPFGFGD
jgi:hypothetical protein